MGAVMNGLAMSGLRPFGSTFLVFSDYMRPAMRMAALMGLPVLFVFSHDSIALGEDGPTHQPVEQLPGLRTIPNLTVFRPCNSTEMYLCLKRHFNSGKPSAIVLSRQSFATVPENARASLGGYFVLGERNAAVKLIATGSEVALAISIRSILESKGATAAVISVPSLELLDRGDFAGMLGSGFPVWIEASGELPPFATSMIARVADFGESGKGGEIYKKYGFDADYIAEKIIGKIRKI
jgi:transketolase